MTTLNNKQGNDKLEGHIILSQCPYINIKHNNMPKKLQIAKKVNVIK